MLIIYMNKALFYLESFTYIYIYINTICFNQKALLSHTLKRFILDIILNIVFLYITNKSDKLTFFFNPILYNDS